VLLGMEYHGLHGATWQERIDWEYTLKVYKFRRRGRHIIRTQERIRSARLSRHRFISDMMHRQEFL
jgi:hypothetical protein